MPIYEFACRKCGHKFEKLCNISAGTDGIECPECGQLGPRKLISGFFAHSSGGSSSSCGCGGSCGKSSCAGCSH
jgi:putative FmdB family regulatory protein